MLAIQLTRFGDPEDSLKVVENAEPRVPAAGQALNQIEYAPLDHHGLLLARGVYPVHPALPRAIGNGGAGTVLVDAAKLTVVDTSTCPGQAALLIIDPTKGLGTLTELRSAARASAGQPDSLCTRSRKSAMTTQSSIGVLGAGEVGRAIACQAVRHGQGVVIGNRRGPQSLEALVQGLGPMARAATAGDAAKQQLVFLAVPFFAVPELTDLTTWSGKIVVDTTNQFAAANPWRGRFDVGDLTGSEWVARQLPGARVVKALNTLFAPFIAADPRHTEGRQVAFYAGDDADAKQVVAGLLAEFGFAALDLGGLREGGRLMQLDGPLSAKHMLLQDVG